jgi:hypothetical protein
MSTAFDIEKALVASAVAQAALRNLPIEMPNFDVEKPAAGLWLKVKVAPVSSDPVTLGLQGEDDHTGFLQIDVNCPRSTGTGEVSTVAGAIRDSYRAGLFIDPVVVKSATVSPGRDVGGFYRVSITVVYYSRIARQA